MGDLEETFPHLFREMFWEWGPIRARFQLADAPPPDDLVSHVRMVPFVGDEVVVIRVGDRRGWDHPGGTLEPGETYEEAMRRELMEEAGARLLTFQVFGTIHCVSLASRPYRPHLPFPEFYHVVGFGQVELVGGPLNPPGGEEISDVRRVSGHQAAGMLRDEYDGWQASLYRLADLKRRSEAV